MQREKENVRRGVVVQRVDGGICSTRTLSMCTTGKEYVAVSQLYSFVARLQMPA
jgi:hypothetical protein